MIELIYIKLFLTFAKIALFNFGGGYAMIYLIQKELMMNNWLTQSEFADIIAIAEMTPGAIAINSATFVGYKVGGIFGAVAATMAIPVPSLIFIAVISRYLMKFKDHPLNMTIFYGIRPVIVGLIISAAILVSKTAILNMPISGYTFVDVLEQPLQFINIGSVFILALTLLALIKYKLHPILTIIGSGVIGVIVFSLI